MSTHKNDSLNFLLGLACMVVAICLLLTLKLARDTDLSFMTLIRPVLGTVLLLPVLAFSLYQFRGARAFAWILSSLATFVLWYAWWPVTITLFLEPVPEYRMVFSDDHSPVVPDWIWIPQYLVPIGVVVLGTVMQFRGK